MFKKGKQYHFKIPYITYWGCDNYHWVTFHKSTWVSYLTNARVNGNTLFTITYNRGKITIDKDQ